MFAWRTNVHSLYCASCVLSCSQAAGEAESKVMLEFAQIEEQLSGVERYAMRILEAESAEFTAQRLRQAEVWR